jgi:hypothetical protein
VKEEFQEELGADEIPVLIFEPSEAFGVAAGLAVRGMVSKRIGLRLFAEYNYSEPDYRVRSVVDIQDGVAVPGPVEEIVKVDFSYVAFGASVSAMLW